jgi:hypothetical protein
MSCPLIIPLHLRCLTFTNEIILFRPQLYVIGFSAQFNDYHWDLELSKKLTYSSMLSHFSDLLMLLHMHLVDLMFMIFEIKFLKALFHFFMVIFPISFKLH